MGLRFVLMANSTTRNVVVYFAEFLFASAFTCNYNTFQLPLFNF